MQDSITYYTQEIMLVSIQAKDICIQVIDTSFNELYQRPRQFAKVAERHFSRLITVQSRNICGHYHEICLHGIVLEIRTWYNDV